MIRRFAVFGDIHAEDKRLGAALKAVAQANVDCVLSVGDVVDGEGDVDRTIELLAEHDVVAVRGNHDRWILRGGLLSDDERRRLGWNVARDMRPASLAWLAGRPTTATLETVLGPLLLCHGIGDDDMTKLYADDGVDAIVRGGMHRIVVCGHTHERWITTIEGVLWLNAGTLCPRGEPGFLVVDLVESTATFSDVAADGTVRDAARHMLPVR